MEPSGPTEGNSRAVFSSQQGIHPRLQDVVRRHLNTQNRKSISEHNRKAHAQIVESLEKSGKPLILDSFCGTGLSTHLLAQAHQTHLVVGLDKSSSRLLKSNLPELENCLLLRADCEPIWQLLAQDNIKVASHYILYPNPWPKARHLKRRVHGHPALPYLLALGGNLELRSNWRLYLEEFDCAMQCANLQGEIERLPQDAPPLSLFERKYQSSGQALWRYRCRIPQ